MTHTITFSNIRYGGISYKVLSYARFKSRLNDGTFSAAEYQVFSQDVFKPYDVKRSISTLARNGHVFNLHNGRFRYVESGVLGQLDNAYRKSLWAAKSARGTEIGKLRRSDIGVVDEYAPID